MIRLAIFDNVPIIDPRNEKVLREQAKVSMVNRSYGEITDTTLHGANDVFAGSLAFCFAENLFYANQLPEAFALKFLENSGETKQEGSKAIVPVTITLSAERTQPYFLAPYTELLGYNQRGQVYSFYLDPDLNESLTIPAGVTSKTFTAIAADIGEEYNLGRGSISQLAQPLNFIESVSNGSDANGGYNPESADQFKQRALAALRRRNLVSAIDFEEESELILGYGSYVKTIGLLNGDKTAEVPGVVHVFLLNKDNKPANAAQINTVYQSLLPRIQLGVTLYVSSMEQYSVEASVTALLEPRTNPETVARSLWTNYQYALSPRKIKDGKRMLEAGQTVRIEEIKYQLRSTKGIEFLERLELNRNTLDVPMPNAYTIAKPNVLEISLVDSENNVFNYAFSLPPEL